MRFVTTLAAVLVVAMVEVVPSHADDGDDPARTVPLVLDDLLRAAFAHAPEIVRAQVLRNAAREAAAGERRGQAWVLTASASHDEQALADHTAVPAGQIAGQTTDNVDLSLGRNLPTGGAIKLDVGIDSSNYQCRIMTGQNVQTDSGSGVLNPCGYNVLTGLPLDTLGQDQAIARVTFQQPLARGLGRDVALASQIRADYAFTESTLEARVAAEEMLRDLVTAYWDLARASYELDVRAQALALATKQNSDTMQLVRAGVVPDSALLSVRYEIEVREEAMVRARVDLEAKSLDLRRRAGLEIGRRDLIWRPVSPLDIDEIRYEVDDLLARSLHRNSRLGKIAQQQLVSHVDLAVARDQTRPKIDLSVSGALIGPGDDVAGALQALGNHDAYEVSASLSMSFELSSAARRGYAAAAEKAKLLDIDRAATEAQIEAEVVTAANEVAAARKRVELADRAIEVSQRIVRATEQSFAAGRTSIDQVVLKQKDLIDAQLTRGGAVADYRKAVTQLEFLSGALLERYRIDDSPR